jgi:hypothetical protein
VGHFGGPLRFAPKDRCLWENRFDDPEKRVRTLYCATEKLTCFYEALARFRRDTVTLAGMAAMTPAADPSEPDDAGVVTRSWRENHVLSSARIQLLRGSLVDLDSVAVREEIAHRHSQFLLEYKVPFLDRDVIQGRNRELTQALGKLLYREGAAGLLYSSKLKGLCAVLFERRARLVPAGHREPLTGHIPEFLQACHDLHLSCDP